MLGLAACDVEDPGAAPTDPPQTPGPTEDPAAGIQEIGYGELVLRIPEQWQVHELSYSQTPMDGNPEVTDDWLLLQTDPAQTCDLDAGDAPGVDFGCAHVMVLGPGSIAVGHGLGQLTVDNPFALGTNPGPCHAGIYTSLPEPANPAEPLTAGQAPIGDATVPYQEWALACLEDFETFELSYHLQRIWHLPEALIVDNWNTDGLPDYVAASTLTS